VDIMKIALTVDGRSYTGNPKDIVSKLRRDAIQLKTRDLDGYIDAFRARLTKDGWGEIAVHGETLESRCESLLVALVRCGFVRPVVSPDTIEGDAVRVARLARGLTQETLASELGVSFSTVNRWESGENSPRGTTARILEEKLFAPLRARTDARPAVSSTGGSSSPKHGNVQDVLREARDVSERLLALQRTLKGLEAEIAHLGGTVVVPRGVAVKGGLTGETITIEGDVEGIVDAREAITLVYGCKVVGALRASRILIQPGASFAGTVTIADDAHSEVPPEAHRSSAKDFEAAKEKLLQKFTTALAVSTGTPVESC
jgi:transcriptional regulator with XRE-family HTH domain